LFNCAGDVVSANRRERRTGARFPHVVAVRSDRASAGRSTRVCDHDAHRREEQLRTIVADVTPASEEPRALVRKMQIVVAFPACAGVTAFDRRPALWRAQAVLKETLAFG
jgi:hypothetical protein